MDFAFRHGGGDAKNLLPVTVVHHECAGARLVDRLTVFCRFCSRFPGAFGCFRISYISRVFIQCFK